MKVIFFDGVCGLCNGFVDFIIGIDKKKEFRFSPLQSDYAKNHLPQELTKDLKSVVFLDDENVYTKSEAVIQILKQVGGIWRLSAVGQILPNALLDKTYDLVAQKRYKMFGKRETCRIPTSEERSRFVI